MYKLYIVYLAALAVAVAAYDFKDSDFNEYLFEEWLADSDDIAVELMRTRRDVAVAASDVVPVSVAPAQKECARRDWKKDFQCCMGDKFDDHEQLESYKEIKKACVMDVRGNSSDDAFDPFDCQKMQQIKDQVTCISACFAKKFGMLNEEDELDREIIVKLLRKKVGENPWKQAALEGYVDKCLAMVKEQGQQRKDVLDTKETKGCNRYPLDFHHCIWREFSAGCPAEMRIDTSKCNKLRERLAKGDTGILNKHLLHQFHQSRHEQ